MSAEGIRGKCLAVRTLYGTVAESTKICIPLLSKLWIGDVGPALYLQKGAI
jgi:hypothetical protein